MTDKGIGKGEILLGFIIIIALMVGFVPVFLGGVNEFSESDACTDANATCAINPVGFCAVNSSAEGAGIACPQTPRQSLPLGTLFSVVLGVIFAAALFVFGKNALKKL